jgi:hypothetical protein
MSFLCLLLLASSPTVRPAQPAPAPAPDLPAQLDEVARVGSVMVDGDVCQRIVTERALTYMFKVDARDQWLAGDNYDVDDTAFIAVKKTLLRLSHLAPFHADVNLWMPIKGHADKIRVVI